MDVAVSSDWDQEDEEGVTHLYVIRKARNASTGRKPMFGRALLFELEYESRLQLFCEETSEGMRARSRLTFCPASHQQICSRKTYKDVLTVCDLSCSLSGLRASRESAVLTAHADDAVTGPRICGPTDPTGGK